MREHLKAWLTLSCRAYAVLSDTLCTFCSSCCGMISRGSSKKG